MIDPNLVQLTILVISSLLTLWVARLTGFSNILLLLLTGFAIGPLMEWVDVEKLFGNLLFPFVSLSVALILFEGGLTLRLEKVKQIGHIIFPLVLLDILLGTLAGGALLYYVFSYPAALSFLIAAILVITGPTVVIPLLRQYHIKSPLRAILRWEAILIDPLGAIGALLILEAFFLNTHDAVLKTVLWGIGSSLIAGVVIGGVAAYSLLFAFKRFWIHDYLHNATTLLFVIGSYSLANLVHADSGLLAVTILGILLANQQKVKITHIAAFKESLSVILIAFLFVALASTLEWKSLISVLPVTAGLVLLSLCVVRPLAVYLCTLNSSLDAKSKLFLCLTAPRGIVSAAIASLFALELQSLGYSDGNMLVPIIFSVIVATVAFTALSTWAANRWLGIGTPSEQGILMIGANAISRAIGETLLKEGFKPYYVDTNYWKSAKAKQLQTDVFNGSFLTFQEDHQEELEQISLLFALTESDDINSLAISHFSHHFDLSELFQIRPESDVVPEHMTGRFLFPKGIHLSTFDQILSKGGSITTTELTPHFTYTQWAREHAGRGIPLFHLPTEGQLVPIENPDALEGMETGKLVYLSD